MKSFFKIFCALFLGAMSLGLVSCGGEDEPKGDDLVEKLQGTWSFYHAKVTAMGQTIEFDADDLDDLAAEMGASGFYDDVMTFDGYKVNGVEYKVDGNRINIPAWYNDWWMEISFKGDEMYMKLEITESGVTIKEVLTYKKTSSRSGGQLFFEGDHFVGRALMDSALKNN